MLVFALVGRCGGVRSIGWSMALVRVTVVVGVPIGGGNTGVWSVGRSARLVGKVVELVVRSVGLIVAVTAAVGDNVGVLAWAG